MKAFIAVSCLLAVASAGVLHAPLAYSAALPWAAPLAYAHHWAGPQHLPVIGPNGVPLDTPEVAAGKVANAVAHAEAHARNGDYIHAPVVASPVIAARTLAAPLAYAHGWAAPQHIPVIGPNGVPLDTPEVAHAKAAHLTAVVDAKVRNGDLGLVHLRKRRSAIHAPLATPLAAIAPIAAPVAYAADYKWVGPQNLPVIGPNGVPLDTPEVAHARAAHLTAVVDAKARNGELIAPVVAPVAPVLARAVHAPVVAPIAAPVAYAADYKWVGPQHLPVIGPNGVPLDTPEVAAGKVANAVAHHEAHARNGDYIHAAVAPVAPVAPVVASPVIAARTIAAPLAYSHAWAAPQHIPVIGPNGVPLDTPEVAAGKVANAVAHAEAHARNGDHLVHW